MPTRNSDWHLSYEDRYYQFLAYALNNLSNVEVSNVTYFLKLEPYTQISSDSIFPGVKPNSFSTCQGDLP